MWGMIGASAIGGLGSIFGSSTQANAQLQAAQIQAQEQAAALAQQKQFFDTGLAAETPFMNTGTTANTTLANAYGLNGTGAQQNYVNSFTGGPYLTAMQNNAAAQAEAQIGKGGFGGNLINALFNQNAGLWNTAYNNQLAGIQGLSNTGSNAANSVMGNATGAGNNAANTISNFSNQIGGNTAAAGSSLGSGIAGAANAAGNGLMNYNLLSMLNQNRGSPNGYADFGGTYMPYGG
jgi:hypothetical protein